VTAVLFTCAGLRVDIVTAFARAGARTVAADASPLAPTLYRADVRVVAPLVDDPAYLPTLQEVIAEHDVRLVVPLADTDQELLAERRDELDALVLLPPPDVVRLTRDKYLAHVFFEPRGIASPPSWLPDEVPADVRFPVLVKARQGYGSRNIFRAADRAELDFFLRYTGVPSFVQQVCAGEEFSIDVFCDLDGRCLNSIPRTMIESKGGESIKGMSLKDEDLIEFGRRVAEALPVWGPANVQCFRLDDGRFAVTDVNTRFGGGFPLPTAAGSRYPELALALANGERPEPRVGEFREGVTMARYYVEVCLTGDDADGYEPLVRATQTA
jgi:carbamoyl-phosphate synthase large subunit